jgi:hypothetical protein
MNPTIDPRDPASISRWEASESNVDRSKIEIVEIACFRDRLTKAGHAESKPVIVEFARSLDTGIAEEQRAALKRFKELEPKLFVAARAAIYEHYRKGYETYSSAWSLGASLFGGSPAEIETGVPKIVKGTELDGLASFQTIRIFRPKDGVSRVGITLGCPWDEENGVGLVIAGSKVERVGTALDAQADP